MPFPLVKVCSLTGRTSSDSPPASGAGPYPGIGGSQAGISYYSSYRVAFYDAGVDLSGVLDDYTHLVYVASYRTTDMRFAQITGVKHFNYTLPAHVYPDGWVYLNDPLPWNVEVGDLVKIKNCNPSNPPALDTLRCIDQIEEGNRLAFHLEAGLPEETDTEIVLAPQVMISGETLYTAGGFNSAWAIGGHLSSLWQDLEYARLVDGTGKAGTSELPLGGTVEFLSGHTETRATALWFRVRGQESYMPGDPTADDNHATIQGEPGAAVMPKITFTGSGAIYGLTMSGNLARVQDFEIEGTNTVTGLIRSTTGSSQVIRRLRVSSKSVHVALAKIGAVVEDCEFFGPGDGVYDPVGGCIVRGNYFHGCSYAFNVNSASAGPSSFYDNLIVDCAGGFWVIPERWPQISGNTICGCTYGITFRASASELEITSGRAR